MQSPYRIFIQTSDYNPVHRSNSKCYFEKGSGAGLGFCHGEYMTDNARHQAVMDKFEIIEVSSVMLCSRDSGDWTRLAQCFHPDARATIRPTRSDT